MKQRPTRRKASFLAASFLIAVAGCRVPSTTPPLRPDGEIPKIDWSATAQFAKAAGDAYETPPVIGTMYGAKNVVVRDLPNTDGRYFILFDHDQKIQTISVRGTNNKKNAWSDINSIKVPDVSLGIFLHLGFKLAAEDAYNDMQPYVQRDYKTRITGHSLGGAVAVILAMHLVKNGYKVEQVITFGQPKVTNEAGGRILTVPYLRVINAQDVVPQLPPSNIVYDLSGPYAHFGPETILHPDKTFTYSPVHIPRDLFTNDLWKTVQPDDVVDHQIKNYIDRINTLK